MENQEDITQNTFFKLLKTQFKQYYAEAEKNCWVICVPKATSLFAFTFSKSTIEAHILQPSPYFQGEYISLSNKSVNIEDNKIRTKEGWETKKEVKIIFEELFYNKEYKPFRVLCISSPLEGGTNGVEELENTLKLPMDRSYEASQKYLESYKINTIVLGKIGEHIAEFEKTYVLVKGYENHAIKRIQAIVEQALEWLIIANAEYKAIHKANSPQVKELSEIVESYVIGKIHNKLFFKLSNLYKEEDEYILRCIQLLEERKVTKSELGIRSDIQCDLSEAINEMKKLDRKETPLSKLICIHLVSSLISSAVSAFVTISRKSAFSDQSPTPSSSDAAVTTDDLIPLMTEVILKSKPKYLHSSIFYMENFIFSNISNTSLGFMLVTFRAAVEYLKSDELKTSLGIPLIPFPTSTVSEDSKEQQDDKAFSNSITSLSTDSVSSRSNNIQESFSESSISSSRKLSQSSSSNLNHSTSTSTSSSHPSQPLSKTQSTPSILSSSTKKSNGPVAPPTVIEIDPNKKSPAQLGGFLTSLAAKNKPSRGW